MNPLSQRGKHWSAEEVSQLLKEVQKKLPIELIAEFHQRSEFTAPCS